VHSYEEFGNSFHRSRYDISLPRNKIPTNGSDHFDRVIRGEAVSGPISPSSSEEEVAKLREENVRLRAEIARLNQGRAGEHYGF
jgi:hypothetical protein